MKTPSRYQALVITPAPKATPAKATAHPHKNLGPYLHPKKKMR